MKSGSVIASEAQWARGGESAQARPAQTARNPDRARARTHVATTKTVRPNAAACSQPAASTGSMPNSPGKASASGRSGAAPV